MVQNSASRVDAALASAQLRGLSGVWVEKVGGLAALLILSPPKQGCTSALNGASVPLSARTQAIAAGLYHDSAVASKAFPASQAAVAAGMDDLPLTYRQALQD